MKKIIRVKQLDPELMHITWIINNICPNSCIYCPSSLHNGSNHNYEWKHAKRFVQLLLEKYPHMHLSIAGGEPSMSPHLLELVKTFHESGHTVSITTNGYKSPEYWREIAQYVNSISFSWHPEFPTEQYYDNLNATAEITNCGVKLMMLSSHWDKCIQAYERLKLSNKYSISPTRINNWGLNNGSDNYTPEQLAWFDNVPKYHSAKLNRPAVPLGAYFVDENGKEFLALGITDYINRGQTNFKNYNCDVGVKSLHVGVYGDISRGNCRAGGLLGNINNPENINWPIGSIYCPYSSCNCFSDVIINKWMS